jgi:hypothetical protein
MTDPTPVTPSADPTAPPAAPPPDPKPAEKKLLDDLKKEQSKRKELEAKLAEALPYLEKFKNHDEAKALEAQREAEARAKQEAQTRAQREVEAKRERAVLKALLGVVPPGDDELAEFAVWKLTSDRSIVYDPETDSFTGLTEAREALKASPRFAAVGKGEPPKPPTPGLPPKGSEGTVVPKFANVKTYADLLALGMPAVTEFHKQHPETYAALVAAHEASRAGYSPAAVIRR